MNYKGKKIVVFGATGNLGANIAVFLKEQGYDVLAVSRRANDNGFFATKGIRYLSVDIKQRSDFNKLPQNDIFAVCHFASTLP